MKSVVTPGTGARRRARLAWSLVAAAATALAMATIAAVPAVLSAQAGPEKPSTTDPRVGLKPGRTDAGVAAKNMTLVSSMGKPAGFFDPKPPPARSTPAETPAANAAAESAPAAAGAAPAPAPPCRPAAATSSPSPIPTWPSRA